MTALEKLKDSFEDALAAIPKSRWRQRANFLTAASRDNFDTVKELATEYPDLVNREDVHGCTALHWAGTFRNKEMAEFLVQHGANIEAPNHAGFTPMHHAAGNGAENIVILLHQRGGALDAKNNEGVTPLMHAVTCGKEDCVNALITCGADCDAVSNDGLTARGMAEMLGYRRIIATFDALAPVATGHVAARRKREADARQKAQDEDIALVTRGLPQPAGVFRKPVSFKKQR
jgi:hypothetical protein